MSRTKKLTPEILDRLIQEQFDKLLNKPDKDKFIDIEKDVQDKKSSTQSVEHTDDLIGTQRLYMDFINKLTPEQRREVKRMFCYDSFTPELLNDIALANKAKLNDKVQERKYKPRSKSIKIN